MSDIFISYKREDQAGAKALAHALEAAGWSVWWDTRLKAGERFDDVIEQEIERARCVIVLWSARSVRSQYVKAEASYALNSEKLIPVTLDDAAPPLIFRGIQTPSLRGWDGSPDSPTFEKLLSDITGILGPPPAQHTRPAPALPAPGDGKGFKRTEFEDVYLLRVPVVGQGGTVVANKTAHEQIKVFMAEGGNIYASYRIVKLMYRHEPRCYEYTVQFKRG